MYNFLFILFILINPIYSKANIIKNIKSNSGRNNTITYHLTIDYKIVNFTNKNIQAMAINNSIPAPTLYFKEGQKAIIYVTNKMKVSTSVHWHGILLPNFQDGVPYLTSPPILPGKTHKFEFTLKQSGTYWYHSHTNLQEQKGLYGAIVIQPKHKKYTYNHDLILVLSDWTNESPQEVLRTLKKGNDWYAIKKGSALSLIKIIAENALWAKLKLSQQRMPEMDISDVYYDAFLINGKLKQNYSDFKAGKKIRLRIINASASTYFWLTFGNTDPLLISADGINIKPFLTNKILTAIAETFDFIITVPKNNSLEIKATAQDGSGSASVTIGKGPLLKAALIPKPDPIKQMKAMSKMHNGGAHLHSNHSKNSKHKMHSKNSEHKMHSKKDTKFSYDKLRALIKTVFSPTNTVREIKLNLTGNMYRYIWSMNNKTLAESDIIKIKKGETIRIHLTNTTMMNHPMHLHGHFFRVLNIHKEYSPLKHTVNIPPMQTVSIEFNPNETGDWFFHCHVLYHMKAGMSRVFRLGKSRNPKLNKYPLSQVLQASNKWYHWAELNIMNHNINLEFTSSNTKNKLQLENTILYSSLETQLSYEYFMTEFFRPFIATQIIMPFKKNIFNKTQNIKVTGALGIKYLLPFLLELEISVNNLAQLALALEYEFLLFSQVEFVTDWQWSMDFAHKITHEHQWSIGLNYIINKQLSAIINYNSDLTWGMGINLKL